MPRPVRLMDLEPGSRFTCNEWAGVLVDLNPCEARVDVVSTLTDKKKREGWSGATLVLAGPPGNDQETTAMTTTAATTTAATVQKSEAVALLQALKVESATAKKPVAWLKGRLLGLPKLAKKDPALGDGLEGGLRDLYDDVLQALKGGGPGIEVVEDGGEEGAPEVESNGAHEAPARPRKGKKEKVAPETVQEENGDGEEGPAEKPAKAKKGKAKAPKEEPAKEGKGAPSNKEVVFRLWKKEGKKFDPDRAFQAVGQAVKITTIKGWVNAWKHDKNLPACAK